jgi:imidazole glycerol-phosphate synthase subunit HisH
MNIAVVDYGMGNLRSVSKALEHVAPGARVVVTSDPAAIRGADRVVVPGQGAMPDCMRQLAESGARDAVVACTRDRPFLGICVGMQMLFEHGEEGDTPGLGLLPGDVPRFPQSSMHAADGSRLKVPHMGWNEVFPVAPHALWAGIDAGTRFYFVHSYFPRPRDSSVTAATCTYGIPFTCAVARDNLFAVQFHPEKSQAAGLKLLTNFVHWRP